MSGIYTVRRELGNQKYRVPPLPKSNERIQAARRGRLGGLNPTATVVVEPAMKRLHLLLGGGLLLVGTIALFPINGPRQSPEPPPSDRQPQAGHISAANLSARVPDLQGVGTRPSPGVAQTIGVMWTEVDHLKRQGQNVRAIEYYLSDLEASRRLGEQGAAASRYAANNLEYEIQRLIRQRGR
jgi:hypothetical protein